MCPDVGYNKYMNLGQLFEGEADMYDQFYVVKIISLYFF